MLMTDPFRKPLAYHTRDKGSIVPLITVLYNIPGILLFDSCESINRDPGTPATPGWFWIAFFIPLDVPDERAREIIAAIRHAAENFDDRIFLHENPVFEEWRSFELMGDNTRAGSMAELLVSHPATR